MLLNFADLHLGIMNIQDYLQQKLIPAVGLVHHQGIGQINQLANIVIIIANAYSGMSYM